MILGIAFVFFSVPLATDMRGIYKIREMISPDEIADITQTIIYVSCVIFISSMLFGLYYYFMPKVVSHVELVEKFLFKYYVSVFLVLTVFLIQELYLDVDKNFIVEFFSALVSLGALLAVYTIRKR